jgi:DNA-binding CsgD family transcriptional regulator
MTTDLLSKAERDSEKSLPDRFRLDLYLAVPIPKGNTLPIPCSGDIRILDTKDARSMGQLYVVIRHESVFDRIYEVTAAETVIGRDNDSALRLPDLLVSREHALVSKAEHGFRIRDLGSRNGTHLNGRLIQRDEVLCEGAEVVIRPYRLKVCFGIAEAVRETVSTDDSTRSDGFPAASDGDTGPEILPLTPAQRRVYDLFGQGLIEKEVAIALGISIHTVHDHAKSIYKALSVSTRGELIADWAKRQSRQTQGRS